MAQFCPKELSKEDLEQVSGGGRSTEKRDPTIEDPVDAEDVYKYVGQYLFFTEGSTWVYGELKSSQRERVTGDGGLSTKLIHKVFVTRTNNIGKHSPNAVASLAANKVQCYASGKFYD